MIEVELKQIKEHPNSVFEKLNRKIGAYKSRYKHIKIGITGRDPQLRFNEHLNSFSWKRKIVIYETSSLKYANTLENWLVEHHWEDVVNNRTGGGSYLSEKGPNYLYVLLA